MHHPIHELLTSFKNGDKKALARCITIVENELDGYEELLISLTFSTTPRIIGITGPPGAGKSTLINTVIAQLIKNSFKIGVIAIDPTSPFNFGSLLGDRVRMAEHFNNEQVFIRSLATRGSLGGLSAKTIEICDVMRAFEFDYIFIETVGVGQSEVEIAGLADITIVTLVPEAGDEIQTIKSGIMEIADIFAINKADRAGADLFMKNLVALVQSKHIPVPVIKTIAHEGIGITELINAIQHYPVQNNAKKNYLLTEKAYRLIQNKRMKDVSRSFLSQQISDELKKEGFNLYQFVAAYINGSSVK